jgi:peroxiredoxin Q/BCP
MRTLLIASLLWLSTIGLPAAVQCPPAGARRTLEAGNQAPDFVLPGSDGRTYRLSDYRGRQAVVLAWFAKAFTGG